MPRRLTSPFDEMPSPGLVTFFVVALVLMLAAPAAWRAAVILTGLGS